MDHADKKYDKQLILDIKVLFRIIVLYSCLPVVFALDSMQYSRWFFQSTLLDGDMGNWTIMPDQTKIINPVFVVIILPLADYCIYPLLAYCKISRPLQKMSIGGFLYAFAYVAAGLLELEIEVSTAKEILFGHKYIIL